MLRNVKRLCAGIAILGSLSPAHAYTWTFTNSGQTWKATDRVTMDARVTNETASPFYIDSGFGSSIAFDGRPWPVPYFFGFGDFSELYQKTIAPGASVDFRFGNLVPLDVVTPGDYRTSASLTLNGIDKEAGFSFAISPVPEPATYAMLGLGALVIGAFARRGRPS
jgi:hypothetical protein